MVLLMFFLLWYHLKHPLVFCICLNLKDAAIESLTTVRPYSNEIHAQAQLWLKKDPKASYDAWKKCLPARSEYNKGTSVTR